MTTRKFKTVDLIYIALFAAIMAVCTWISIPLTIPFTLQTFAIFAAVGMLGGKRGTLAVLVYVILGAIGLPVFSGFSGGVGKLMGPTGGYIIGFIFAALVYWLITKLFGKKTMIMAVAMLAGLLVCYAFGTAWFIYVYTSNVKAISVVAALGMCVVPYIIPDIIKIALAILLVKRVGKHIKI